MSDYEQARYGRPYPQSTASTGGSWSLWIAATAIVLLLVLLAAFGESVPPDTGLGSDADTGAGSALPKPAATESGILIE